MQRTVVPRRNEILQAALIAGLSWSVHLPLDAHMPPRQNTILLSSVPKIAGSAKCYWTIGLILWHLTSNPSHLKSKYISKTSTSTVPIDQTLHARRRVALKLKIRGESLMRTTKSIMRFLKSSLYSTKHSAGKLHPAKSFVPWLPGTLEMYVRWNS
jgi:hypothetical protein